MGKGEGKAFPVKTAVLIRAKSAPPVSLCNAKMHKLAHFLFSNMVELVIKNIV